MRINLLYTCIEYYVYIAYPEELLLCYFLIVFLIMRARWSHISACNQDVLNVL